MKTLIEEEPFVSVVSEDFLCNTCSSCFVHLVPILKCKGCLVVGYCNRECQLKDWSSHKIECQLLQRWMRDSPARHVPNAEIRLTARILVKTNDQLAKKSYNGRSWHSLDDRTIFMEQFEEDPNFTQRQMEIHFLEYLLEPLKKFNDKFLWNQFAKVKTNYLEIHDNVMGASIIGLGIYLGLRCFFVLREYLFSLSVHENSCVPDSWIIFTGKKAVLRCYDEDATYSSTLTYSRNSRTISNLDRPNYYRKRFLKCHCDLCMDPDLLLNRMGVSARSFCCKDGAGIRAIDSDEYSCFLCGAHTAAVRQTVSDMHQELNDIARTTTFDTDIKLLEGLRLLKRAVPILSGINNDLFDFCRALVEGALLRKNYGMSKHVLKMMIEYAEHYYNDGHVMLTHLLMTRAYLKFSLKDAKDDFKHERAYRSSIVTYGYNHPITSRFRKLMHEFACLSVPASTAIIG